MFDVLIYLDTDALQKKWVLVESEFLVDHVRCLNYAQYTAGVLFVINCIKSQTRG